MKNSLELGKIPPQALDIEEAVLGALMLEKNALDNINLTPIEFYKDIHQIIFSAIIALDNQNKPIDLLSVAEYLRNKNSLEEVGGLYFLSELTSKVATASNIEYHSLIIHDKFIKRELIKYCFEISNKAYDDSEDTFDVIDSANIGLDKINNSIQIGDDCQDFRAILKKTIEELKERERLNREGKSIGIPTPIKKLTKYTSGWKPKNFIVIGARPGAGKTAIALAILKTASQHGFKVFMTSLEMSCTELAGRILVGHSGINADNFKFGSLEPFEWELMERKINEIIDLPVLIDDKPKNINRIKSKTKLLHRKGLCDILIIDYIQLAGSGEGNFNREQEISHISRTCKLIAQELDICVVALSQLNREVEKRPNKRPTLSDLRESGSIEQDADIVGFIYRPEMYGILEDEEGNSTKNCAEFILAKHRGGQTGIINFKFNDSLTEVYDEDYFNDLNHFNPDRNIEPNKDFDF